MLAARTGDTATTINCTIGHPNDIGYEHTAQRLYADLRRLSIR